MSSIPYFLQTGEYLGRLSRAETQTYIDQGIAYPKFRKDGTIRKLIRWAEERVHTNVFTALHADANVMITARDRVIEFKRVAPPTPLRVVDAPNPEIYLGSALPVTPEWLHEHGYRVFGEK